MRWPVNLSTRLLRFGAIALGALVLTVLTQIGGIVLVLASLLGQRVFPKRIAHYKRLALQALLFVSLYATCTVWVIPPLAAAARRTALPCRASAERPYAPAHWLYCALNRNYVDPRLAALITQLAKDVDRSYPGTITLYLDASFPFFDGFPMAPHLSHNDGLKLDLAYFYKSPEGDYLPYELRSPIGYWGFEERRPEEATPCPQPVLEHQFAIRLSPHREVALDANRTGAALRWLATKGPAYGVEKVFIEPYLANRLGVSSPVLAFQGCHAARHDDHIHIQITRGEGSINHQ